MTIFRFLFGSGWWICWYLAFYAAILLFVVLILLMFAQEVKPAGQAPNTPSPGSIMVVMIALTLGLLTLVNAILFVNLLSAAWYVQVLIVLLVTAAVTAIGMFVNIRLATAQSYPALYANIAYILISIALNLVMMWFVQTRPWSSIHSGSQPVAMMQQHE